ncbi:MAG: serine protease [Holophaga sp.]|nr:serine protease [Holophaga sp.]
MSIRVFSLIAALSLTLAAQTTAPSPATTPSVVKVSARSECATSSQGSGVVVAPGIVATSAHVVQGTTEVKVMKDGITYFASAHILAPELDLCLLRVPALPAVPVTFASEDAITPGLPVKTLGFPGGQGPVTSVGSITGLWRFRGAQLIQSNAAIHSGSSGGGLFTEDGRLAGITTFVILSYEGLSFCLPATWISELLNRPWQHGTTILACKSKEILLQEFLDGMTEDPTNRMAWQAFARAWVASRPRDSEAWYSLGHSLFLQLAEAKEAKGQGLPLLEAAQEAYGKALELDPSYARAWNNLGVVQDTLGESAKAVLSLRRAVQLQEHYGLAWLNLGSVCMNIQHFEEAAHAYQRGLARFPDEAQSWVRLALCEEKLGRREAAIRHLRIALRLRPMQVEWWTDLAQLCQRTHRQSEFETTLAFLRQRLPDFANEISHHLRP